MCEENEPTMRQIGLQKVAVHLLLDKLLHPAAVAFHGSWKKWNTFRVYTNILQNMDEFRDSLSRDNIPTCQF